MPNVTSSQEFQDGLSPCDSPDGQMIGKFLAAPAHASPSHRPASVKVDMIPDTCGRPSADSLRNASQAWFSASKSLPPTPSGELQKLLGHAIIRRLLPHGSMVYRQALRVLVTPAGFTLLAHTASGRSTSDSGCTGVLSGWPSPIDQDAKHSGHAPSGPGMADKLSYKVSVAGWGSPRATDGTHGGPNQDDPAALAGWATPASRDEKGIDQNFHDGAVNNSLPNQVAALGTTPSSSPARTASSAQLAAGFPLWLMGFPETWRACCPGYEEWELIQRALRQSCEPPENTE